MISRLARPFFLSILFFSLVGVFAPSPAQAALVPCGTSANPEPCTVCHIAVLGNGIIAYALRIMTYVAIAVIVAMAILYIVSTGDEGLMKTAKSGITAALVGFAILLGAWLIVNTTLNIMAIDEADPKAPLSGLRQNGMFSFTCDTVSSTNVR